MNNDNNLHSSMDDLGYCRGARSEKVAMLEAKKLRNNHKPHDSTPDLKKAGLAASTVRRTHSEDIKERMKLLEVAMAGKTQWTRGDLKPIDKNDPDYGKPQKGTWTAERGQKAHNHVHKEILELCEFIYMNGLETEDEADPRSMMFFGNLFTLYTRISDKVVGILLRARKYGLVHFEPEILYQGRDDDEPVILLKPMQEIYAIYKAKKSFAPSAIASYHSEQENKT